MVQSTRCLVTPVAPCLTRRPFTIIELLVVIGTILILMAMLLPAITKSREKAKLGRWEGYMRNQRVQEKMVLQYMFLDDTGSDIVTNSAQGIEVEGYDRESHHGSLQNVKWQEGRWFSKQGPQFNGFSSLISCAHLNAIDPETDAYSAIAWIKPETVDARSVILGNADDTHNAIRLGFSDSGELETLVNGVSQQSSISLVADEWVMVAVVQDESGIYLHKFSQAGHEKEHVSNSLQTNPERERPFLIGGAQNVGSTIVSSAYDGMIDEVVIYSRSLGDNDLLDAYKMGSP